MIGIRSAISIRARGHRPHLEAVYMTAPRSACRNTKKLLPRGGRPYMTEEIAKLRRAAAHIGRKPALEAGLERRNRNRGLACDGDAVAAGGADGYARHAGALHLRQHPAGLCRRHRHEVARLIFAEPVSV